jgi:hypothetical protein
MGEGTRTEFFQKIAFRFIHTLLNEYRAFLTLGTSHAGGVKLIAHVSYPVWAIH